MSTWSAAINPIGRRRSPAYRQDLDQFLIHAGIADDAWEQFAQVRPKYVVALREQLAEGGIRNSTIRRKLRDRRGHPCSAPRKAGWPVSSSLS